jgi:hypothetical protein
MFSSIKFANVDKNFTKVENEKIPANDQNRSENSKAPKAIDGSPFNNFIGYILFTRPDNGTLDAFKIYNEGREDFTDSHTATFNSVQFAGRNEPVCVYYQGSERKFSVKIELFASRRGYSTPPSLRVADIPRDLMTITDVDYISRMALALTYSNYKMKYSGPHRVWLTYGNFIKMIPCVLNSVSRVFVGSSPVDRTGESTDFLPYHQKITFELTACPEELTKCPDSEDIMTDSNANKSYGIGTPVTGVPQEPTVIASTMQAFDFVRRVNLLLEQGRRIIWQAANPFQSAIWNDLKNSVTQYANLGNQFTGFDQQQLNTIIDKSLPANKVRLYK